MKSPRSSLSVSAWLRSSTCGPSSPTNSGKSSRPWSTTRYVGLSLDCSCPTAASAFLRTRVPPVLFSGSVSISAIWWRLGLSASRESILVCLTNLLTRCPPMPPKLNRRRAMAVLSKIDAILAWEARHENERDTRFVELGKYLCEVRAGQYWPARTSQRYWPSSTNLVSRSFSCRASQARIASILLRTTMARRRLSLGGIGGHLVSKFVKQTKIDSRLADKPSLHQIALIETEPEKRTGGTRVLRKADAAVGQEQSRLNPTYRVVDQGRELLPLLVGDDGPQVLDLNHALTDKDDLGDFIDSRHPGITDQLRIQRRNAVRLLRIAGRAGLPLQHTRCAVQFAYCIDEGDKAVARTQGTCESDLLMAVGLANLDAAVLDEALEQLNALLEHVVPGVVA